MCKVILNADNNFMKLVYKLKKQDFKIIILVIDQTFYNSIRTSVMSELHSVTLP